MRRTASALVMVLAVSLGMQAPALAAVSAGHWAGGDIDFRIEDNRIKKLTVTSVHTCQGVGTGEFWNELQTFGPPGRFSIGPDGRVSGQRLRATAAGTDYYDIRFAMVGRFVRGTFKVVVQTSYKYYDYTSFSSPTNVNCFSEKKFSAQRKRG